MKKLVIFIFGILCINSYNSIAFQLENEVINIYQMYGIISYENKVALYGQRSGIYAVDFWDGEKWNDVPLIYDAGDGALDTIRFPMPPRKQVTFGPSGDLWIGGPGGYFRWDGNTMTKYPIGIDNYPVKPTITGITFDSTGNIWFNAEITIIYERPGKINIGYATNLIIKYDGTEYSIIDSTKFVGYGHGKGNITTSDGRVIFHNYSIHKNKDNLIIFNGSGSSKITLKTPHNIIENYSNFTAMINDIFEDDEGNIWFALGANDYDYDDSGISVMRKDGSWFALGGKEGYKSLENWNNPFWDSTFVDAFGITQDNSGRIWVSGQGFINVLDEDNNLVIPDTNDLFDNSVFYGLKIGTGKIDERLRDVVINPDSLTRRIFHLMLHLHYYMYPTNEVPGITATEDGSLWIAFGGLGVLRYKPSSVNVEENNFVDECNIFPQPLSVSNPELNIIFGLEQQVSGLHIFDLQGKIIYTKDITPAEPVRRMKFNLSSAALSSGTYYAAIYIGDKIIFKKLIIN